MPPISRRRLLAGTGLVTAGLVGAAGVGATIAALSDLPPRPDAAGAEAGFASTRSASAGSAQRVEVATLTAALARENQLVDQLTAATTQSAIGADPRAHVLPGLLSDHRAHAAALAALLPASTPASATSSPPAASASVAPGTPQTIEQVQAAEQAASAATGQASAIVRGAAAVLLASIAACEAGHVELIS